MAGIFDNLISDDPKDQAYMALAAGLLGGRGSFNKVAGEALMGSQNTYRQARQAQEASQQHEMQRKLWQAQMQKYEHDATRPWSDMTSPASVREFQFYNSLPQDQKVEYNRLKRAQQVQVFNGIPHQLVNGEWTPMTDLNTEAGAREALSAAQQRGKESVQADYELVPAIQGSGSQAQKVMVPKSQMLGQMPSGTAPRLGAASPSLDFIRQAMQKNGDTQANYNLGGVKGSISLPQQGPQQSGLRVGLTPAEEATNKAIETAGTEGVKDWYTTSWAPVAKEGQTAQSRIEQAKIARAALEKGGFGGWGSNVAAAAANMLSGLGVAPESVRQYAANAQIFQQQAMERLWVTLNTAKGPQTEGDADRARQTFAQLANTPEANKFILDLYEATAERDQLRYRFYTNAKKIAAKTGDMAQVDEEWQKRMPSIFDMPTMKRWKS